MRSAFIITLCFGVLAVNVCDAQTARAAKQRAQTPLTSSQIEQLIKIGTPDEVISQEIRDRGVIPAPKRADLDRLAQRGAGGKTIAALRELAKGVLNVTSRPGESEVQIDGKTVGRTGPDGRLVVADVAAGDHSVRVQKDGFQSADFPINIDAGGQASIAAALESARGSISVVTSVPEAAIRISGLGTYRGAARDIRCPAGSYVVDVTAPRFAPVQRTVVVAAGQLAEISIKLEPDTAALDEIRQQLRSGGNGRNAAGVIQAAEELLRYVPSDPEATGALAAGQFASGNLTGFRSTAPKALSLGGMISVRLIHHHALTGEHEASLGIKSDGIIFDALGARCTFRGGKVPADRITRVQVVREHVMLQGRPVYREYVDIQFRLDEGSAKTGSMKFTIANSQPEPGVRALAEVLSGIFRQQPLASLLGDGAAVLFHVTRD